MKKSYLALLATAAALAIVPAAMATPITTAPGTYSLGTEVGSTSGSYTIDGVTFSFTEGVYDVLVSGVANGDLAFEYTVTDDSPTLDNIAEMSTAYGAYSNSSLLLQEVLGDAVTGNYATTTLGTVNITFANGGLGASANGFSGADSSEYILYTDATVFQTGNIRLQDDTQANGTALVPGPEPSSLLLLGTGLLGLAFVAFRKAKASGMALGM